MVRRSVLALSVIFIAAFASTRFPAAQTATVAGTAMLTGTVESSTPYTAAQVFIRNTDKRMLYMVYTNGINIVQSMIAQGKIGFWVGLLVPHAIAVATVLLLFRQRMGITGRWRQRFRAPAAAAGAGAS